MKVVPRNDKHGSHQRPGSLAELIERTRGFVQPLPGRLPCGPLLNASGPAFGNLAFDGFGRCAPAHVAMRSGLGIPDVEIRSS